MIVSVLQIRLNADIQEFDFNAPGTPSYNLNTVGL